MCIFEATTFTVLITVLAISKYGAVQSDRVSSVSPSSNNNYGSQREPDAIVFPTNVKSTNNNYQQHHHHTHYHDFHHHHHHQPHDHGFEMESDNDASEEDSNANTDRSSLIPLDLIGKMNDFSDINDLLRNFVEGNVEEVPPLINRFGEEERSAVIVPKAANCMPELQTVKIKSNDDPSVLYIPSCTRIERCGGCCSHSLLSCQPKNVETLNLQVVKTQFVGGSKLKFMGKEVVLVEKHTKCKCDCKVQEKDCNNFQEYRKTECRCVCTNTDEEKKCYKDNSTKLWNPEICVCQCRNILQCSTGYTFDTLRCRCVTVLVRRRYAELQDQENMTYDLEALPIVPSYEVESTEN